MRSRFFAPALWCALALLCAAAVQPALAAEDTRLVDAVRANDRTAALALLARRAAVNVNGPEVDGTTALHWAVHHGDVDLVGRLLRAGAKVNVANQYGATPLSEAATVGSVPLLDALLKAGADVRALNSEGESALMLVARTGNIDAARLLIARGADVNASEKWRGQSALMWAVAEGQAAMVVELIRQGADVNARSAVNAWERDVTAEPRRKYMPRGGFTPLLYAAREGCLACAAALIEAGADVNFQDPDLVPPLSAAIVNGQYDVAALLVERGADVNRTDRWGRTPLWSMVDMHTPPRSQRPDVFEADAAGGDALLRLLLARGADVNAQLVLFPPYRSLADRGSDNLLTIGATPLIRAAKAGDAAAMTLLLERGAAVDALTADGITPLLAAAGVASRDSDSRGRFKTEQEAIEAVGLLLAAGANINAVDNRGVTAVHGAAFWGFNELVQFLADRGARLDAKDRRGMTPIDSAMGRAGGNGFGGNRIDVHADTAALIENLLRRP